MTQLETVLWPYRSVTVTLLAIKSRKSVQGHGTLGDTDTTPNKYCETVEKAAESSAQDEKHV